MKVFDEQTARALVTILVFIAAGAFIYGARQVLIFFVFAILFAYVLDPWVSRMERWRKASRGSRTVATLEVYALLILALALTIFFFAPRIVDEGRTLATTLPTLFDQMSSGQIARKIGAAHGWSVRSQFELQDFLSEHRGDVLSGIESLASQIVQILSNSYWIVLVPILAFFFLKDGQTFADYFLDTPQLAFRREFLANILRDLNEMMAQYIRVQLIMAGLAIIFYMAMLWILRVPYALILGAVAGVLEFLPTIGPALAGIMILGVAFVTGYKHLLVVFLLLGIWRIMQDYVTFPRVTSTNLKLHPLAAIFAILVGFEIGGIAGAYLSIPIMAGARIVRMHWRDAYASEQHEVHS